LWREPLKVVVDARHELAVDDGTVSVEHLARFPLLVCRGVGDGDPELQRLLTRSGVVAQLRVVADNPLTLTTLARAGVGVAVLNAVALAPLDLTGLAVLELDAPAHPRAVAAYWNDVLLDTDTGRRLHRAVMETPLPAGAVPLDQVERAG
jgi:DNA-binding transcriptional LysR family regulator